MPLMTTRPMFEAAYGGGFAVGSFVVFNLETVQAVIEAAVEEEAPVILLVSKRCRTYAGAAYLRALIRTAVELSGDLPIAVHLHLGQTPELCQMCLDGGFTGARIDASDRHFHENVQLTRQAVQALHPAGLTVEGRMGFQGGIEDGIPDSKSGPWGFTGDERANEFLQLTGIDCLTVTPSTACSAYKHRPMVLQQIDTLMHVAPGLPLALHGDVLPQPEPVLAEAVRLGVCQVNYNQRLLQAMTEAVRHVFTEEPSIIDPRRYLEAGRAAVKAQAQRLMLALGASGQATTVLARWRAQGCPVVGG